jgi:hypothetical protein
MESVSLSATPTTFGVDKIKVVSRDFCLKTLDLQKGWQANMGKIKANYEPDTWSWTLDGRGIKEEKWFCNDNGVHLDVSARGGLSFHFNPSTLDHEFELTNDLERSWEKVKRQLDHLDIQWNEEEAGITRVDLTKQRVMEHPSYVYTNALGLVKGKRMGTRTYGSNAVEVKNTQRGLICYDKTLELREKKQVTTAPDNLLRMEARWSGKKSIGALHTGLLLTNVGELVNASTAHLEDCYNKFLTNHVFRTEGEQLTLDLVKEKETLEFYINKYGRQGVSNYLFSFGVEKWCEAYGSLELWYETLKASGIERTTRWRYVNRMREAIQTHNEVMKQRGEVSPLAHLEHLKTTFTAPLYT